MEWLLILSMPFLIGLNAFFVAAEYSIVAVRSGQIEGVRRAGGIRAAAAMGALKDDLAGTIGATQIGITVVGLLLGFFGEPALGGLVSYALTPLGYVVPASVNNVLSLSIALLTVTLVTVVLGELLPKALTLQNTVLVARWTAVPMRFVVQSIAPMIWLSNGTAGLVTKVLGIGTIEIETQAHDADEIGHIVAEAAAAGRITPRERSLIQNSLALGRKRGEQVMVPRVNVAYLDLTQSMEENSKVMNSDLYSRLPLCDGGLDRVVGVVYTKEFLTAYMEPGSDSSVLGLIARPAVFVPVNLTLDRLLAVFRDKHSHMVFLVDEYGGMEGLVTLTDVVDELVGEISENASSTVPSAKGVALVVPGKTALHDLAAKIERPGWAEGGSVHTVGGLLGAHLGHIPAPGEEIEVEGVRLRVIESSRTRVTKVRVSVSGPAVAVP